MPLRVRLLLPLPLAAGRAILALLLLHLLIELFHELLDFPALQYGMACGVSHRALCTGYITVRQLAGALVTSLATLAPIGRCRSCCGHGCSG
jgi:hypothetical protein